MSDKLAETTCLMEFAIERFGRETEILLEELTGEHIPVVPNTHTEYFNPDVGTMVCEVPESRREGAAAEVPIITIGTNVEWMRNTTTFSNKKELYPASFVAADGSIVAGYEAGNPVEIMDFSLDIRFFHTMPQRLLRLQQAVFMHFDRNPYLFIPADLTKRDGVREVMAMRRLIRQWFQGEDLEIDGFFLDVSLPRTGSIFASNLASNLDNVYVSSATVYLENLPIPDGIDLGKLALFREAHVEIKTIEDDVTVSTIDMEAEEEEEP